MLIVYVDQGSAWLTVIGGFVANILLGGLAKSYGLVMEAFQEIFQSGSAYLLMAGGLIYTLMYCLSLLNHYISTKYGTRPLVFVGAFGSCISLLVAAYSRHIAVWVVAIGIGLGASLSCIYFTVFSVIGRCFKRHLGLANGISVSGVSVGQMAFPPLITYLNLYYGTRAATAIVSAICLHLLITAALMPQEIIDSDVQQTEKDQFKECSTTINNNNNKHNKINKNFKQHSGIGDDLKLDAMLLLNNSVQLDKSNFKELEFDANLENCNKSEHVHPTLDEIDSFIKQSKYSLTSSRSSVRVEQPFDAALARDLLIVYIVAKAFADVGDVSVSFIAPAHGIHLGFDSITVSWAIGVSGAVDLFTRLIVGWLTDREGCIGRRGLLMAFTWLLEGTNALAFSELNRLTLGSTTMDPSLNPPSTLLFVCYFICFAVHGVCSGTAMTQMVVVLSDWVGSSRLSHSLALTMVVLGLLISPGQFAIGFVADKTFSYVWPMRICAIILILAGFILLLEFPVRRLHQPSDIPSKSSPSYVPIKSTTSKQPPISDVICANDNDSKSWKIENSDLDDERN